MSNETAEQTRHTGRFQYRFVYAAYDNPEWVESLHREAKREMGNLIGEAVSDGRLYQVQQKREEKPHLIFDTLSPERETQVTYSVTIALLNQDDAQVGELVVPAKDDRSDHRKFQFRAMDPMLSIREFRVVDGEFLERVA